MSDANIKEEQSSNGASNESTNKEKSATKKSKRAPKLPLASQVATLEAEASGNSDPAVVSDLNQMQLWFKKFEGAKAGSTGSAVSIASDGRTALKKIVRSSLVSLSAGLRTVPGGVAYVHGATGTNDLGTARNIQRTITPATLGHNGPLFDAMVTALANFDRADADWKSAASDASESTAGIRYVTRMLELTTQALRASLTHAAVEAEMKDLLAPPTAMKSAA